MIKAIINAIIAHNLTFLLIGTSTTYDLPYYTTPRRCVSISRRARIPFTRP